MNKKPFILKTTKTAEISLDVLTKAINDGMPDLKIPPKAEFSVINDEGHRYLAIKWNECQ